MSILLPIIPDPTLHLRLIGQLAADVFSNGQYVDGYCDNYIGGSHYDWQVSRLVLDAEKLVHHWGVWGYQMRLESTQLKVAGIGAVVTHPDYRKQGYMHTAAQASFEAMVRYGYDLSILRGRHYARMGYARAWNYVTYRFKLDDFALSVNLPAYRLLGLEDIPEMDALYNTCYADFSGSAVRPTYRNRHPDDLCVYGWYDVAGKLLGYVRAAPDEDDPKTFLCLECAGDHLIGLAVLADLFHHSPCEKIACFGFPHLHPLLQYLRKGSCTVEDRYFDISGWRVRIVNLESCLRKLTPLLEMRLAESTYATWQGHLLIDAGDKKTILHIDHGKIDLSQGPASDVLQGGAEIARLLIGSDEVDEIISQGDFYCTGRAISLARVLFPCLHPMLSHWDEY